jgi:hypothetical protein
MDGNSEIPEKAQKIKPVTFVRWTPVAILLLFIVNGWYLVLSKGLAGEFSWYSMQIFYQSLALYFLS